MKTVEFEGDAEQGGFTIIQNVVLVNNELSVAARLTYILMRFYAWQDEDCWPGQDALAGLLGCTVKTLRGYVSELVSGGLVRVERRGQGRTNRYILTRLDGPVSTRLDVVKVTHPYVEEDSVKENTEKKDDLSSRVKEVFDHWRTVMNHPKAKLDPSRRSKIGARLRDGFSVEELKSAIDGCRSSEWHMGQNENKRKYNDISLICRDASRVEAFQLVADGSGKAFDWDDVLAKGKR